MLLWKRLILLYSLYSLVLDKYPKRLSWCHITIASKIKTNHQLLPYEHIMHHVFQHIWQHISQENNSSIYSSVLSCRVRVFDLRAGSSVASLYAHHLGVTSVQADDWKIVSGGEEGLVCVWEMRMGAKLWEMHNRWGFSFLRASERWTRAVKQFSKM